MQPLSSAVRNPLPFLERFAGLSFGFVAAVAALALWGWALDIPTLRDFAAGFPPMPPAAALAFLLLSASFFVAGRPDPRPARAAAALAGTLAVLSLVQSLGGVNLGMAFDFLPAVARARGGSLPMSPATALVVGLLAVGAALRRDFRLAHLPGASVIAGTAGAVAFFSLLGWSLRMVRFEMATPLLGFSLPAALAALAAALAIAARWPGRWLLETLAGRGTGAVVTRSLLPAAFAVPVVFGWMRLLAEREGLFGEAFGMALFTLVMIGVFGALVLWVAQTLERIAAQRAQAEEQAGEQREWLHVTLASIGDGVIATDAAGRVRFLNAAAQRLTGWRAAEAAGRPAAELLPLFDERNGAAIESPLHAALDSRTAASAQGEPALRARDGTVHAVDVNAAPIVDATQSIAGAVLVLREAAAQRKAERAMREAYTELDQRVVRRTAALERASAALRERNALLNAITTSTPDLIYAKDRQGRLLMANPAWANAVGRIEADPAEHAALDDSDRVVLESGETMTIEQHLAGGAAAAAEKIYLATKSPLRDEQGRVVGLIGVATDITERKKAQRELEKLVVAEQRLRAEAERANRAKDEFLAIVSHELRSPLNALRGWSHLLITTRPFDPALADRAAKAIKRNVDHQTRLIDDLLDTSRIVSGKLNIDRRPVDLVETVLAALEAARPGASAKNIELRFRPVEGKVMVMGDGGRLQQLASNLLSNAVKFTPDRGAIEISFLRNGERVQLIVRDNGIGIAPEFLPHVFDRFTQADTSAARRAGGLGIGLALVRHIALLHGGQVRADSQGVGRGATFTVELPALAPSAAPAPEPIDRRKAGGPGLRGARVWLVDDDVDAHEVVALTLKQTGARVESFASCAEVVAALESSLKPGSGKSAPDLFLIDLAMPGEDGFETLRRIRSLEMAAGAEHAVPAIALTAFTQIERERLLACGFQERVNKPVDADKLVLAMHAALVPGEEAGAPTRGLGERRSAAALPR
ncbi:MAG: PAS domain-containing protein [Betaproteobacteria bacterium]|nr:PAS domain-containing protein [Betaproteobacteria bacterium]